MAERDPLTQQYLALWQLLEDHAEFSGLVKIGNRIKLTTASPAPIKSQYLTSDLPEIKIQPALCQPHLSRTSNGSSILCRWQVVVSTGNLKVDEMLLPLQWEIFRAMANWAAVLMVLTWKDKQYVKRAQIESVEHGLLVDDVDRGIQGWAALWSCMTESFFTTASLLET